MKDIILQYAQCKIGDLRENNLMKVVIKERKVRKLIEIQHALRDGLITCDEAAIKIARI